MRTFLQACCLLVLAVMSLSAAAHGRPRINVHIGGYWAPWWIIPSIVHYSVARPVVIEREEPIVIDETTPPQAYWYYCRSANAYYPYVKSCPEAWEEIPAQPIDQ